MARFFKAAGGQTERHGRAETSRGTVERKHHAARSSDTAKTADSARQS
ncbi:MAG: hypothetical protein ABL909_03030 [Sphingopyxis sp.]